jgi:hypothetical protein
MGVLAGGSAAKCCLALSLDIDASGSAAFFYAGARALLVSHWRIDSKAATRLSDEQWRRIEPCLPTDVRGVERVDDRRVVSGIVHVLKSGCRWCDTG